MEGLDIIRNEWIGCCAIFQGCSEELLTVIDEVDEVRLCWPRRVLSLVLMGVETMCCG